jgi:hypothetical protein
VQTTQRAQAQLAITIAIVLVLAAFTKPTLASAASSSLPSTPRAVKLHLVSIHSVTVSWSAPINWRSISPLSYVVRAENSGNTRTCVTTKLQCTFNHLANGQMYVFWVLARDSAGLSRSTRKTYIETIAGARQQTPGGTTTTKNPKPITTTSRPQLTAANWASCDAPIGGTIQFDYSNGTSTQAFVNNSGYGGLFPPVYETAGNPGGTSYGYYLVTKDNMGNMIPGGGLAFYVSNFYGCTLAP